MPSTPIVVQMVKVPATVSVKTAVAKSAARPLKAVPKQPAGEALQERQQHSQRARQAPIRMASTVAMDVVCRRGGARKGGSEEGRAG
jgi:hypothetical protein